MKKLGVILETVFLICFILSIQGAIVQNPKLANTDDRFVELKPNVSLLLRSTVEKSSSFLREAFIYKTILNAIRMMPLQTRNMWNDMNQRMYGDGVEHKFPPFLERIIQRIQTYFSVYKYTDTSNQPVQVNNDNNNNKRKNETLNIDRYNGTDVNLTTNLNSFNKNHKTSLKPTSLKPTKPTKTNVKTTTTPITATDADEENEFIEIKKLKTTNNYNNKKS